VTPSSPKSDPAKRWIVLAITVLARTGVGMQFIAIAALMPQMRTALDFSYTEIGLLLGLFMTTGIFLSLPSGMIAGRFGDGLTLRAGLVALIVGSIVSFMADGFAVMLTGRLCGGLGAVLVTVTGAKLLTEWFDGREIATAMSMLGVTWPIGIALGLSVMPLLAATAGWRMAVAVSGLLPALALLASLLLPKSGDGHAVPGGATPKTPPLWSISRAEFRTILAGAFAWPLLSSGGYVVFSSYAPGYLTGSGLSHAQAGLAISLLSWLFVITIPLGGYIADRSGRPDLMYWTGAVISGLTIALVPVGGPVLVWVALTAIMGFTVGPVMALPGNVLSAEARATGLGVFYTIYYLGTVTLPAAAGWLLDTTGSVVWVIWFAAACTALSPLSLGLMRYLQRGSRS
jgi:predicted MFS family arabinose efflux permease